MVVGVEAGVHTHYRSEQEEEEGVYGGDPGARLFFMGFFFFLFNEQGGDGALRQYSVDPVWLSAASRSASTRTASIVRPTSGRNESETGEKQRPEPEA